MLERYTAAMTEVTFKRAKHDHNRSTTRAWADGVMKTTKISEVQSSGHVEYRPPPCSTNHPSGHTTKKVKAEVPNYGTLTNYYCGDSDCQQPLGWLFISGEYGHKSGRGECANESILHGLHRADYRATTCGILSLMALLSFSITLITTTVIYQATPRMSGVLLAVLVIGAPFAAMFCAWVVRSIFFPYRARARKYNELHRKGVRSSERKAVSPTISVSSSDRRHSSGHKSGRKAHGVLAKTELLTAVTLLTVAATLFYHNRKKSSQTRRGSL